MNFKILNKRMLPIFLCALCMLILQINHCNVFAQEKSVTQVIVNGKVQTLSVAPVNTNGTLMVSMRDLFEILGAEVSWSKELNEATAVKGDISVIVKVNSKTTFVNNRVLQLTQSATIINDKVMIPLRVISEAFGAEVKWNGKTNTVTIKTKDAEEAKKMSYSTAINTGIRKSFAYQNAQISADKASNSNEDLTLTLGTYNLPMLQAKEGLKLADKWAEINLAVTKDQVGNSIKNTMDNVSIKQEQKKDLEQKIDFLKYKLKIERIKYEDGTTSLVSLQDVQTEYSSALQNLMILEKEIDSAYTELNSALGTPYMQRDQLEFELNYEPMGEVDLDRKIKDDTSTDPYIWLVKQQKDLAAFKLATYEYNFSSQSWTLTDLDLSKASLDVENTEKALADIIQSRYNQLRLAEENLKSLQITLEQVQRKVNNARLQYDAGMITKAQLEEAQRNVAELQYHIRELQLKHKQLKVIFEKPYLAPEYMS